MLSQVKSWEGCDVLRGRTTKFLSYTTVICKRSTKTDRNRNNHQPQHFRSSKHSPAGHLIRELHRDWRWRRHCCFKVHRYVVNELLHHSLASWSVILNAPFEPAMLRKWDPKCIVELHPSSAINCVHHTADVGLPSRNPNAIVSGFNPPPMQCHYTLTTDSCAKIAPQWVSQVWERYQFQGIRPPKHKNFLKVSACSHKQCFLVEE